MRRIAILLTCLALAACATGPTVTVPRVPEWIPAREVTSDVVNGEALRLVRVWPQLSDTRFTLVNRAWLDRAMPWSWEFAKSIGLAYTPESFDCDKFAKAFSLAAEISAARAGVKAAPLIARLHVKQVHAWGGVPAGGSHAVNAVATDDGVLVVDIQTRAVCKLADYPNLAHIYAVKIGD